MPRLTLLALGAWLGLLGFAGAQGLVDRPDPGLPPPPLPPYPLPHDPELPPQPMALPPADGAWQYIPPAPALPTPAAPAVAAPSHDGAGDERVGHLLQAAEHLESAGLAEQAARLRQQAREQSLASLLARKLAEVKKLQAEIEQLRQAAGADRYVKLEITIAEASQAKVREWLARYHPTADHQAPWSILVRGEGAFDWCKAAKGAVSVLSRPTVATVDGQSAKCFVGGSIPLAIPTGNGQAQVEVRQLGLSLEVTPHVLGEKRLRLEVRYGRSELDRSRAHLIGQRAIPGIRTREVDATIELNVGETAVLVCMEGDKPAADVRPTSATDKDRKADDKVTLVFVTPTLMGEKIERSPLPSPVAEKPETAWWDRLWRK